MRRVGIVPISYALTGATVIASSLVSPSRSIYTTWGSVPCEKKAKTESWLQRITNQAAYRSFEFLHVPEADAPEHLQLNSIETYLLSCIEDDTKRLLHIGWGYDFDPFWHDRVNSLDTLYRVVYCNEYPLYKFVFGSCSHKLEEKQYMETKLNYLKSVLYWAARTERRFTAIAKARYYVQRKVWNALERERYLCACVEAVDSYGKKIPEEFRAKAMSELEVQLVNMRHWVFDCPNGKRTFTRRLA